MRLKKKKKENPKWHAQDDNLATDMWQHALARMVR